MNNTRTAVRVWLIALIVAAGLMAAAPADELKTMRRAIHSITAGELKSHVAVLADDSFEGREAGSRGGRAAGEHLMKLLKKNGLEGAGSDGGYFQDFGEKYRNILGVLPGSDPKLKKEVIVIGAHYDHVGYGSVRNSYGPTGYIHNGADDNASGVAGLLEVIEAFGQLPKRPRRTVLFAFWDGEEKGLLGSKHWASQPTIPFSRIVFAVNIDMIGRMRKNRLEVIGSRSGQGLRSLLSRGNHTFGLELDFTWETKKNSDHYSFFERNIPVLMLHTGLHDDYHRPSDDVEKLNTEGLQQIARLLFHLSHELANGEQVPRFRDFARHESNMDRKRFEQPLQAAPPRLGVRWLQKNRKQRGMLVSQVNDSSAAERAGLQAGDRIVRFNGKEITDEKQFRSQILSAEKAVEMVVHRSGQEKLMRVQVQLDGKPVRIGVSWRIDEAEPNVVLITRVVVGSPAEEAGLRLRDRIYEVSGKPFQSSDAFVKLLTATGEQRELLVERNGRFTKLQLRVLAKAAPGQ